MCYGHDPFEVLQIIQANGWKSVYERGGVLVEVPLVAFALVRNNDDRFVFIAGMNLVADDLRVIMPSDFNEENDCKFLGYLGPGELLDKFQDQKRGEKNGCVFDS